MGYLISITINHLTSFILCKLAHSALLELNGFEEEQVVRILERHPKVFTRISVSLCNNKNHGFSTSTPSYSLFTVLSAYPLIIRDFPEEVLCSIVAIQPFEA